MKRRIFISMCAIATLSVIFTTFMITLIHWQNDKTRVKEDIRNIANLTASTYDKNTKDFSEYLKTISKQTGYEVTWVASGGWTLFDSNGNEKYTSDNELKDPEFSNVRKYGESEYSSKSELNDKLYFYCAVLAGEGTIIRIGVEAESYLNELITSLPYLVIILSVTLIIIGFVSNIQTDSIIKPINEINFDTSQPTIKYDELKPLLKRIEKQNYDINKFIKTLKDKQNEFQTVTQNMDEGLIILKDRNILTCNQSALRILGSENIDYTGISINDLSNSEVFLKSVDIALNGKTNEVNLPIENKNYTQFSSPVFTKNNVTGAVILLIDSTEKYSNEKLRREFSANVSHELKTPLTTISGYAEIMKEGWVQPQDFAQFSEKIYNEARRMISLIDDIINLSKLDENSTQMVKEQVDLPLITKDVINALDDKASKKNITLKFAADDVEIYAIPHLLYEMIYNLIDNAIKYNKNHGKVFVAITNTEKTTVLSIKDTGIGIPNEDKERVFERFYCVDKSHSKETGGTGLGLSIVKHAAQLHDAIIDMESTLGVGTKISLTFNKI